MDTGRDLSTLENKKIDYSVVYLNNSEHAGIRDLQFGQKGTLDFSGTISVEKADDDGSITKTVQIK